jgi:hypothetical protein
LASSLGIALGLANLYLKRLARKGYIKVSTIPPNRLRYLLTPRGLAEKTRLTYEFMDYSVRLYRETRGILREALASVAERGQRRVVLYGTGEAAELAYLTIVELGLTLTAVVVGDATEAPMFLGNTVRDVATLRADEMDAVVVATFDSVDVAVKTLRNAGIDEDKIVVVRR